jgi:phosphoglycerate dehydrogenase-like enzyme
VFSQEPLPAAHAFWQTENLYITQHTAAISKPEQISPLFINNYMLYSQGLPLQNQLDFSKGY